ncbi:MAG: hypothetical protein AB7O97_13220 [Planctomycetota bacterium]
MTSTTPTPPADPFPTPPVAEAAPESVIIRPWPKVVFLYPTTVAALLAFLLRLLGVEERILGNTFMCVLCMNLFVFSFDFSRIKSITFVIGGICALLLLLWLDTKMNVTGFLGNLFGGIDIRMNAAFYGFLGAFLVFVLLVVFVNSRFHYYEVNAREILHHHGYLGDITRWSTDGLEMNKEIYDMAEYILLRSGRLIFMPATSKKAIVIDNVAKVNRVEERVNDLLSHVAVRFNQRPGPG